MYICMYVLYVGSREAAVDHVSSSPGHTGQHTRLSFGAQSFIHPFIQLEER
jgi:hypothetical protein